MKKTLAFSLASGVLLAAILASCSTHTITTADFVGTWTATKWTETNLVSPYQTVDVIAVGGVWAITIISDGSYTGSVTIPEPVGPPVTILVSGTSTILDNNTMVVHQDQGPQTFHISHTLSGNTWTLMHIDGTYKFDSVALPSRQNITATRS
jgi:hypothetical protein